MTVRVVHLADLHIGDAPRATAPAAGPPDAHDPGVARRLASWWRKLLWSCDDRVVLVVCGDLTRDGSDAAMSCAHRYVHARWALMPVAGDRGMVGLEASYEQVHTVPGNSDRVDVSVAQAHFRTPPWVEVIDDNGFSLVMVGFDTTTQEVTHAQLRLAEQRLQHTSAKHPAVRCAVMHHGVHELRDADAVRQWIDDLKFHVVLAGHAHRPARPPSNHPREVAQLVAGAALQANLPQHLYEHQVSMQAGSTVLVNWTTLEYRFDSGAWRCKRPKPDVFQTQLKAGAPWVRGQAAP